MASLEIAVLQDIKIVRLRRMVCFDNEGQHRIDMASHLRMTGKFTQRSRHSVAVRIKVLVELHHLRKLFV